MDVTPHCGPRRVIGYWMSEKKSQKLNWSEFSKVCRKHGFELVKLNLNACLEDQGPFTVIIHKLTDIIASAVRNDIKAIKMLQHVENYIKSNPEVVIIDPVENVRKLLDRYRTYGVINDSDLHKIDVFTPPFVDLTSNDPAVNLETLKRSGVCFPFVCKPLVANGTDCHKMAIVFNEKGLKDCSPPCVAHSFVNHNAVLYKLFIVGNEYHIAERPSLKNFYPDPDRKTIHFDSHDVSKPDSSSSLSVMDDVETTEENQNVDPEKLKQIVSILHEELGMNLLGVDVVVENTTGRHAIIDINPYPGYDGYPDFFESLMRCIKNCIEHKTHQTIFPEQEQEDSGFETADSSDEKKRRTSPPMLGSKVYERRL
ncbi:Inositol 1, 3, 4-trisphosphate 5/6-kinase [Nesidiocoris tenuis]|uniref:Inositol-tetrakisphosphate 1-kinase n=1 Tax=Nesidiocoris tenuis TaxID=355587 RepID=A0ABN7B6X8_9HEMI|nr:Inositol 1, 3, 4-trisphosphate 5/6-kinase [Nesidiocoris tenuis]